MLLEPYTDGLVLVTRPGYTEEALLNETVQEFIVSDQIRFLGAVINAAEIPVQISDFLEAEESDLPGHADDEREKIQLSP